MDRRNVSRKDTAPVRTVRMTDVHIGKPKKKKTPKFVPVLVIVLLIIAVVIFIIKLATSGSNGGGSTENSSETSMAVAATVTPEATAAPESQATSGDNSSLEGAKVTQLDSLLTVNDARYEYYSFVESTANEYITIVNDGAKELEGIATLYEMIIPTSMDIVLPRSFIEERNINTSDQQKAINYMYSSMSESVKKINVFDTLKSHSSEYVYFRTDHHWTALGAYYAYCELAASAGFEPLALTDFTTKSYKGYLGSFYWTDQDVTLGANPDVVDVYIPTCSTTLNATQKDGTVLEDWPLIYDGDEYDESMKYNVFIAGDQPYEEIKNNDLSDGSSCIVVKESFGNCFVPFLTPHYNTVYVIDYRYWNGNIKDLAAETGAKDVFVLNNISATRSEDRVADMDSVF